MRPSQIVVAVFLVSLALPAHSQSTLDRPVVEPETYRRDSGALHNATESPQVLHVERIALPGAAWLRVYFGATELAPGSFVRIRSALDGEVQELDANGLAAWNHASAYFNGDAVDVELIAGPRSAHNRLVIEKLAWEAGVAVPTGSCGICDTDDRVPSGQDWTGRVLPAGCTGSVWKRNSCVLSAGHCVTADMVIEFGVPDSNPDCSLNHPPPADQFPIVDAQSQVGPGNDWAVMTAGANDKGQKPYERYGVLRPLAAGAPSGGQSLSVRGFGIDDECPRSQTQQFSTGSVTSVNNTWFQHDVDVALGNSGSAMLRDDLILGLDTHCPCPSLATRIDHPNLVAARAALCDVPAGTVGLDAGAYACNDVVTITVEDDSIQGAGSQAVTLSSTTESEPETAVLTEDGPISGVFIGSFPLDDVPQAGGDGRLSVGDGDTITVEYIDADDGEGGIDVARQATATVDCVAPAIFAVQAGSITTSSATISWSTDEPADSVVDYGLSPGELSAGEDELVLAHSVELEALKACSGYFFSVSSSDGVGNTASDDNGGAFYAFTTACVPPPPIPDGSGGTQPMTAQRFSPGGDRLFVSWDNQCVIAGTNILFGPLDQVSSYGITGSVCSIPPVASFTLWDAVPPGDLWFLLVNEDGFDRESSWGQAAGGERNGSIPSGQCGVVEKDPAGACP